MHHLLRALIAAIIFGLGLSALSGCTTAASKKALNKPMNTDSYSGFDAERKMKSERKVEDVEPVADDTEPEKAVSILIEYMTRREHHYRIPAEDQLRIWATKQGVDEIVIRKLKAMMLIKHPRIEVRAPALRLTIAYGKGDSMGDLVEVLADEDFGMRSTSFKALQVKTGRNFGYNPSGGTLARSKSIEQWRQWWQQEQQSKLNEGQSIQEIQRDQPPAVSKTSTSPSVVPEEGTDLGKAQTVALPPPRENE